VTPGWRIGETQGRRSRRIARHVWRLNNTVADKDDCRSTTSAQVTRHKGLEGSRAVPKQQPVVKLNLTFASRQGNLDA
jgi:hypothetical protein